MYYYEEFHLRPNDKENDVYEQVVSFLNENNIPKENIISIIREVNGYVAKLIYWA